MVQVNTTTLVSHPIQQPPRFHSLLIRSSVKLAIWAYKRSPNRRLVQARRCLSAHTLRPMTRCYTRMDRPAQRRSNGQPAEKVSGRDARICGHVASSCTRRTRAAPARASCRARPCFALSTRLRYPARVWPVWPHQPPRRGRRAANRGHQHTRQRAGHNCRDDWHIRSRLCHSTRLAIRRRP
jgi:hypothetical protein